MQRRYGFFSSSHPAALACQHNRLATLRAEPYSILAGSTKKPSKASSKPPRSPSSTSHTLAHRASTQSLLPTLSSADMALEEKRIDKWGEMLVAARKDRGGNTQDWTVPAGWWDGRAGGGGGKYRKLQRRVFKGVPDRWRRAAWGLMMERMAEEVSGRERVQSLEALQDEYRVRLRLSAVAGLELTHSLKTGVHLDAVERGRADRPRRAAHHLGARPIPHAVRAGPALALPRSARVRPPLRRHWWLLPGYGPDRRDSPVLLRARGELELPVPSRGVATKS